jgi:hypothetical protein
MKPDVAVCCLIAWHIVACPPISSLAEEEVIAFAVISETPKNPTRISAKVAIEGEVSDSILLVPDHLLSNLIWKKLEICHAMKLEGRKVPEGFRITSARVIDGAMLPMVLQGYAGDCLLRKALEIAPYVD